MSLFSWDEMKREQNWALRNVEFAKVVGIFDDPEIIELPDRGEDYGEERIRALGQTGGAFSLVAYTWRGETRHIITAWKVGEHGKKRYKGVFARRDTQND